MRLDGPVHPGAAGRNKNQETNKKTGEDEAMTKNAN
jgi:hypothetical protein